ncbi:MAG: YncE family protein [Bradymonadaceae bacterium]
MKPNFAFSALLILLLLTTVVGCSSGESETDDFARAFVPNAGDGTVSVINLETLTVIATVLVSPGATGTTSHGVAVDRVGGHFFVGDVPAGVLRVYDTTVFEEVARIELEIHLHGIDLSPAGLIVASGTRMGEESKETVLINAADFTVEAVLQTDISGHATSHPAGRYVYIADIVEHRLAVIDLETRAVVGEFFVGPEDWPEDAVGPNELAFSPDGKWAYSADFGSQTISIIDTSDPGAPRVTDRISMADLPHGIEVTPDSKTLWIANRGSRDVVVLDAATHVEQARISVAPYSANHTALSPDGRFAYVTVTATSDVSTLEGYLIVLDTSTFAEVGRIELGITPHEISLDR